MIKLYETTLGSYLDAFIYSIHKPTEHTAIQVFGKGITCIIGLGKKRSFPVICLSFHVKYAFIISIKVVKG